MSTRRVVKLRKSPSWVMYLVACEALCIVPAWVVANLPWRVVLALVGALAMALLPVVRIVGDELVMSSGPFKRRIPLTEVDAFGHLISGKYEGLGYSPALTFKFKASWGRRFTTRFDRGEWLVTLRHELARTRPTITSLDQRGAAAGVGRREMKAVTISTNRVVQRVALYDRDVVEGGRPRYTCLLPVDTPTVVGMSVEVFGNSIDGDVVLRLPNGGEIWPVRPLSPPPYRSYEWAST